MPRKITAYACEFKCGRGCDTNRKRMADHEARCKKNQARRACPTCRFEMKLYDEGFDCFQHMLEDGKMIRYDCEGWEPR